MGCDIHMYLEYKKKNRDNWINFGERFNPGRHYGLFAKLADVRNYWKLTSIVNDRGIPNGVGYITNRDNTLYVCEKSHEDSGCCTPEEAESWGGKYANDSKTLVYHPDWHSHSWCTPDELQKVFDIPKLNFYENNNDEYIALLASARNLEENGNDVRFVFWFDN